MSRAPQRPRHGGAVRQVAAETGLPLDAVCDFSANINPLGPPPWMRRVLAAEVDSLVHYPEPDADRFRQAAAARLAVDADEIVAGNGAAELIAWLPRATRARRALIPSPAYVDYALAAQNAGLEVIPLPLHPQDGFALDCARLSAAIRPGDIVFIGRPNNPTGLAPSASALVEVARLAPDATLVVDEAFIDFCQGATVWPQRPCNVVLLRSLTKFFCIPGLRAGFAVACPDLAAELRRCVPPWSMNSLAQAVGTTALQDPSDYAERTRALVTEQRERLRDALAPRPGLTVFDGQANFLLLRCDRADLDAVTLGARLRARALPVRICDNYHGLDARYFRIAVRAPADNERLLAAMAELLDGSATPRRRSPRRAGRALMVQGTSSNAGKSVLVAALCRILLQDGINVAPFKAQNMSLNSFVTDDGGEMGRAQVVQAQACRLPPDVRMNPVLLKPSSDVGSQVVVAGQPVGNMRVGEYIAYKPTAFAAVKSAYASLAADHDVVLLEGAGSPAEVNLKHHDIVNMRMAQHAHAPVLLVGDIDRGGIFASFVGTLELLDPWERQQVAGFVINRFRGKQSLLDDALDVLRLHTARPCLGVIPYVHDLGLPEEDSVSFKDTTRPSAASDSARDKVDIALIDLPHISNFTDCDALRMEPDVNLRVVRSVADLGRPHAVIVPGSKSVVDDLSALRERGLADALCALGEDGAGDCEIIGVCGGLQMLGKHIDDPHAVESGTRRASGLGLLPITTTLASRKTLVRAEALHVASRRALVGYEIHHGETRAEGACSAVRRKDGVDIGFGRADGRVWGTYLHGLFDADGFRHGFLDTLRRRHALAALSTARPCYDIEPALDRLAAVVRDALDMTQLYRLLGL